LVSKDSKCSSRRGCPARKHVERSLEDPSMLWLMKRNTVTPKLHFNLPA